MHLFVLLPNVEQSSHLAYATPFFPIADKKKKIIKEHLTTFPT